jgi:hypothetical protein
MYTQGNVQWVFEKVWEEAGFPPIQVVTRKAYGIMAGKKIGGRVLGMANITHRLIWINRNHDSVEELFDTVWHEVLHCMFPNNPEWWIECSAYKLSNKKDGWYGFYADKYNKTPRDVPSKRVLMQMIIGASSVMNGWSK